MGNEFNIEEIANHTAQKVQLQPFEYDDLRQTVAMALIEKKEVIENARDPEAMAYSIARNKSLNFLREKVARPVHQSFKDHQAVAQF